MIKADKGTVEINGTPIDICTELTMLIKDIKKSFVSNGIPKKEADHLVSDAVRVADMSMGEVMKELIDLITGEKDG